MTTFSLHRQLTLKQYRKLTYLLLYRRPFLILITALGSLFIIYNLLLLFTKQYDLLNENVYGYGVGITAGALTLLILPFFSTKRNFKTNYRLSEPITYEFSAEGYTVTGESFNSKMDWNKVYKVRIMNDWLLLYHSRAIASLIKIEPREQAHIAELKEFLTKGNFKAKLKW